MQAQLRFAGPDDAATILGLIRELALYEREPDAVTASVEVLRAQLAADRPPFECLLADLGGRAVGFALFFPNYSTWLGKPGLYLEDLYVQPPHRGRGIGLGLLRRLAQLARERGCARIDWSVLNWNQPAIDLYRSLDARAQSDWTGYRLHGAALARLAAGPESA